MFKKLQRRKGNYILWIIYQPSVFFRGAYNIQPQKLVASQYIGNEETQRTDTRHRHKSNSRKSTNDGNQEHRYRTAKQSQSHSPQISMTFCPEKCNCGFKNQTNQLEVNHYNCFYLNR